MIINNRTDRRASGKVRLLTLALAGCLGCSPAFAFEIDTGNPDIRVRWDNTLKYTAGWRVKNQSSDLISGEGSLNHDDGNRNFDKGMMSNRLDLLTELDVIYARQYGFRLSGSAWYDDIYNKSNDHDSPNTANHLSVRHNKFNSDTRELHGRKAELLDAFVFGGFDLGDTRLNVRAGRHSVLWGESLFYGMNGIAGAMAPVDVVKLMSVPGTQFKEAIRPVPQISAQWQFNSNLSLGAFYQFRWEENRLPTAGSYFSGLDFNPDGGEARFNYPGVPIGYRVSDMDARNSGQFGLQMRFSALDTDFGVYAVRFHSKTPQQVNNIGGLMQGTPHLQSYQLVYHEDITAYGASASRTFNAMQVSVEGSIRDGQDLASTAANDFGGSFGLPVSYDNHNNTAYAVGKTAHVNISTLWTLPSTPLANEASLTGEIIWNRVLSVDKNPEAIDPTSTRDAFAMRVLIEPMYRQVRPGLDLSVPIGVGYSPKGSRSRVLGPALPPENGGDFTIGLNGSYLDDWRFSLAYTHYFGSEATLMSGEPAVFTYQQFLKDRDFVTVSLRRTF